MPSVQTRRQAQINLPKVTELEAEQVFEPRGLASVLRGPCSQEFTAPLGILPRTLGPEGFWSDVREVKPGQASE